MVPFIPPLVLCIQRFNDGYRLQLGIAIGFLFPPMLVQKSEDLDVTSRGLQVMFYIVAAFTTIILVLILLCEYLRFPVIELE